jgi:hypothetical protein
MEHIIVDTIAMDRRNAIGFCQASMLNVFNIGSIDQFLSTSSNPRRFTVKILRANIPNGNNRTYTMKTLEAIVRNGAPEFGSMLLDDTEHNIWHYSWRGDFTKFKKSHAVENLRIIDSFLVVDIFVLDNEHGNFLLRHIAEHGFDSVQFRTACQATCVKMSGDSCIINDGDCKLNDVAVMKTDHAAPLIKQ